MRKKLEAHDITDTELEKSYWFVTHWEKIKKRGRILLMIFTVLVWLPGIGNGLMLLWFDAQSYRTLLSDLSVQLARSDLPAPFEALRVGKPHAIRAGENRYDFFGEIENPNSAARAQFDYTFWFNNKPYGPYKGIAYPGETRIVIAPSIESILPPRGDISIENLIWNRMDPAAQEIFEQRHNFRVSNALFKGEPGNSRLTFTLTNNSIYYYWEMGVALVLKSGSDTIAVQRIIVQRLKAGEARAIQVVWPLTLPGMDSYDIRPEIDVFDSAVFWYPEAEQQKFE